MQRTGSQPSLFISHSSNDGAFAQKLISQLEQYALPFWYDARELYPSDNLRAHIEGGIKSSDVFVILVSYNSVNSSWVEFELDKALHTQESPSGPVVIPVVIDDYDLPGASSHAKDMLGGIKRADFREGWAVGFSQLLQGIYKKTRQVVTLRIDKEQPLQLETATFQHWLQEYVALSAPLLFVLDDLGLVDELGGLADQSTDADANISRVRLFNLLLANFCFIMPRYVEAIRAELSNDNEFFDYVTDAIQALFTLIVSGPLSRVLSPDFIGNRELHSVNYRSLWSAVVDLQERAQHYTYDGDMRIPAILNVANPLSVDLVSQDSTEITSVSDIFISSDVLASDFRLLAQYGDADPSEIPLHSWLKICVPQIAARHVIRCSNTGQTIHNHLAHVGLSQRNYSNIGLH